MTWSNVHENYPDVEITQETLQKYMDADVGPIIAKMWANSYGTIRSLSGATVGQLQIGRGVDDGVLRELFGTSPDDLDLTVAHRQKNRGMGVFSDCENSNLAEAEVVEDE